MTWLFLIGRWLKEAATALFGVAARYPWQCAFVAALCLAGWFLHGRTDARSELADIKAAQVQAHGAQKRLNDAAQTHYTEKANVADTKHEDMVAAAFDATAAYVAKHRVQPEDRTCKAPASAASGGPEVHAELPAAGVVVAESDVQRCAAWQAYGVAANTWAQSLALPENLLPGE